jgi:hypothetical protein
MEGQESTKAVHRCQCAVCQEGQDKTVSKYHEEINLLLSHLNEPQRRWYVGTLSRMPEGPDIRTLVAITGMSSATIMRGRHEIEAGLTEFTEQRQRKAGGGRPRAEKKSPTWKQ